MNTPAQNPSLPGQNPSGTLSPTTFTQKKDAIENCYLAIRAGGKTHDEAARLLLAVDNTNDYATRQGIGAGRALMEALARVDPLGLGGAL